VGNQFSKAWEAREVQLVVLAVQKGLVLRHMRAEDLVQFFVQADVDGTGRVSFVEFTSFIRSLDVPMAAGDARRIFSLFDKDGNEQLTYHEFCHVIFPELDVDGQADLDLQRTLCMADAAKSKSSKLGSICGFGSQKSIFKDLAGSSPGGQVPTEVASMGTNGTENGTGTGAGAGAVDSASTNEPKGKPKARSMSSTESGQDMQQAFMRHMDEFAARVSEEVATKVVDQMTQRLAALENRLEVLEKRQDGHPPAATYGSSSQFKCSCNHPLVV